MLREHATHLYNDGVSLWFLVAAFKEKYKQKYDVRYSSRLFRSGARINTRVFKKCILSVELVMLPRHPCQKVCETAVLMDDDR